jgi:DNA-binding MarR family transcriptional regulator
MNRAELLAELMRQTRVQTTWTVLLHHAVAAKADLHVTDMECVNLLQIRGPQTPGRLAEAMALTTGGAITAVIDRLVKAGLATRRRDDLDRRRILVELTGAERDISGRFRPISDAYSNLLDQYSEEDLKIVLDFIQRSNAQMPGVIQEIRSAP